MGVLRPFVRLYRRIFGIQYEQEFDRYMLSRIRPGDVVWDVGANVGYFTEKFAEAVGPAGEVLAFEPSPDSHSILCGKFPAAGNVQIERIALSNFDGNAEFSVSSSRASPTNALVTGVAKAESVNVKVNRADSIMELSPRRVPNRIKIDVEGYEDDVLAGMQSTLSRSELRSIFIEVHFQELNRRGRSDAPTQISSLLKGKGFSLRWIDPSHVVAER